MIAVIDYGAGNVHSVAKALAATGVEVKVTGNPNEIRAAEKIILPGVGSFGDCMTSLKQAQLDTLIKEEIKQGKPLMGICVGLQILFEGSEEAPGVEGLKIFKGKVKRICAEGLKVPHMGWNCIAPPANSQFLSVKNKQRSMPVNQQSKSYKRPEFEGFFNGIGEQPYFYFVHSYHAVPEEHSIIAAVTDYGECLTAAVARDNVFAVQFHPEKSGDVGLQVLKNFIGRA